MVGRLLTKIVCAAVMLFINIMLISPHLWAAEIRDIRVAVHDEGVTRFVLELDEAVPFRIFTLNDPKRLIIDFPESRWAVKKTPKLQGTVIAQYRTGIFRPGIHRIVLDLKHAVVLARHDSLENDKKFRIFIDIVPVNAPQSKLVDFSTSGWKAYLKKQRTADQQVQKPASAEDNRKIVVIDPGHGGIDPGGVVGSIKEKHIVLSFCKLLKKELEKTGRYRAVLTRSRDVYLPLRERFKVADHEQADIFISVHADKIHLSKIRGTTVYTLSEKASDAESEALAQQENRSDVLVGEDLSEYDAQVSNILIDLAQEETNQQSWRMAKLMVRNLKRNVPVSSRSHRFAGFAVLKSPNVPSILIELGYLTNKSDLKNLQSITFKGKVADAIVKGIDAYFREFPS